MDEAALLDARLERRLRGPATLADLDDKARARLVRGLVGQGFSFGAVLQRLRSEVLSRGSTPDPAPDSR